jgi:hypothetical protein
MKGSWLIIGIIAFLTVGCVETEPVSTIPHITFKDLELVFGYDSLYNKILIGKLEFSFIDGDADIGIDSLNIIKDTTSWYENNYNVFLKPYEKIDTNYYAIPNDSTIPPPYFTIFKNEKLDRSGQNKTIKGTITLNITYEIIPPYDTIKYEFYIRDRAGNNSNVEVTSDIGFKGISLSGSL